MSRMLATKASLSVRVDALAEPDVKSGPLGPSVGIEYRAKLESRLRALEHRADLNPGRGAAIGGASSSFASKKQPKFEMNGSGATYNTAADSVQMDLTSVELALEAVAEVKEERRNRKEEKKALKEAKKAKKEEDAMDVVVPEVDDEAAKKEKKRLRRAEKKAAEEAATETGAAETNVASTAGKKRRAEDDDEPPKKKSKKPKAE